jgi:hypothetical protein
MKKIISLYQLAFDSMIKKIISLYQKPAGKRDILFLKKKNHISLLSLYQLCNKEDSYISQVIEDGTLVFRSVVNKIYLYQKPADKRDMLLFKKKIISLY